MVEIPTGHARVNGLDWSHVQENELLSYGDSSELKVGLANSSINLNLHQIWNINDISYPSAHVVCQPSKARYTVRPFDNRLAIMNSQPFGEGIITSENSQSTLKLSIWNRKHLDEPVHVITADSATIKDIGWRVSSGTVEQTIGSSVQIFIVTSNFFAQMIESFNLSLGDLIANFTCGHFLRRYYRQNV